MDSALINSMRSIWVFFLSLVSCDFVGESDQHLFIKIYSLLLPSPMAFSFVHAKCTMAKCEGLWQA